MSINLAMAAKPVQPVAAKELAKTGWNAGFVASVAVALVIAGVFTLIAIRSRRVAVNDDQSQESDD